MAENPIIQAVVDIWYDGEVNALTLMTKLVSSELGYKDVKQTDTMQIPEIVRKSDPNLKRQPVFEISKKDKKFKVTIGDGIFGVALSSQYNGWSEFKAEILSVFKTTLGDMDFMVSRIGMKYTDHMEDKNIFDKDGSVRVSIRDIPFIGRQNIQVHSKDRDFNIVQSIMYPVEVVTENEGMIGEGSLVDTIVALEKNIKVAKTTELLEIFDKTLDDMHDLQKREFKKVITDDFAKHLRI